MTLDQLPLPGGRAADLQRGPMSSRVRYPNAVAPGETLLFVLEHEVPDRMLQKEPAVPRLPLHRQHPRQELAASW